MILIEFKNIVKFCYKRKNIEENILIFINFFLFFI